MLKPPKGMHFVTILFRLWWCIVIIKGIKFKDLSGIIGHICSRLPCYILTMIWLFCASLQNCHPTPRTGTSYINKQKEKKRGKSCCLLMVVVRPWDKLIPLFCVSTISRNNKKGFSLACGPSLLSLPPSRGLLFSTSLPPFLSVPITR